MQSKMDPQHFIINLFSARWIKVLCFFQHFCCCVLPISRCDCFRERKTVGLLLFSSTVPVAKKHLQTWLVAVYHNQRVSMLFIRTSFLSQFTILFFNVNICSCMLLCVAWLSARSRFILDEREKSNVIFVMCENM